MTELPKIDVDAARLLAELERLATFSSCPEPPPAVTRVVYSPEDVAARGYLRRVYEEAGLVVREDAIGNVFARWEGSDPALPAVATGSHCDAIPHAGMYDGTVGVLGGVEAIRALQRAGYRPRRSIEVVMITSEEPTRFGIGCLGSRALAGSLTPKRLSELVGSDGVGLEEARRAAGCAGDLSSVALAPDYYSAWVELHIEQGPELEAVGVPIGVVSAIAAPSSLVLEVEGEGGHAGGVLMPRRRDALCAAAELTLTIERLAKSSASPDLVATVGELDVHPGAVNSIPSKVRMTLDLRDVDGANRDTVLASVLAEAGAIGERRGVTITHEVVNADPPAACDPRVVAAAEGACDRLGLARRSMPSRAYHDSLFMARVASMGMLFIPCRGGVSHRPDEFASLEALGNGAAVLALTLARLAG
jgi:N-carbamoyl-L-amino-acid hydrolase